MSLRLVLAALCIAGMCFAATPAPRPQGPALHVQSGPKGPALHLALRLRAGERLVEYSDIVDRTQWVLPPERLAVLQAQGFVIHEEIRTSNVSRGTVRTVTASIATIKGTVTSRVRDVPRGRSSDTKLSGTSHLSARNVEIGTSVYPIEGVAMVGLPVNAVRVGSRWTTTMRVLTALGSGTAVFEHVITGYDGARIRVDVNGSGTINGKEYNLPRLLPGTIELHGSAWFDPASGLITQESYHIENRLIKPAGSSQIGFIERMDVQSDMHEVR